MGTVDATDRVRLALQRLVRERKLRQTRVAERLGIAASAVNRSIHGPTPVTVSFLEAVELETGVPIAELVAPPGTTYQLDGDEAALLRALRRWPKSVQHALLAFLGFFADEPPELMQTRNLHELWRRMPTREREWFYGIAVMLREGTLAPDLQAGIVDRVTTEAARRKERGGRRDGKT